MEKGLSSKTDGNLASQTFVLIFTSNVISEVFTAVNRKNGTWHRVGLVRADVSEELSASIIRVRRHGELGTLGVCVGCWLRLTLLLVRRFLSP
jgi:hypothetical protein